MTDSAEVIEQTKRWINDVVVGCNFCPFAAKVIKQQSIFYQVENSSDVSICINALLQEAVRLDDEAGIETTILIFPNTFAAFDDYLDLVADAEDMLIDKGYEGVYQLASFHPLYQFADAAEKDAANYTNRSVYPMLHLLRESSIDKALESYTDPESIPGTNINFARNKGLLYMKMLRDACF